MANRGKLSPDKTTKGRGGNGRGLDNGNGTGNHGGQEGLSITSRHPVLHPESLLQRPVSAHVNRSRPRSASSLAMAALEGLLSLAAFCAVWTTAIPIITPDEHQALGVAKAVRSGACLAIATPFLFVLVRLAILIAGLRYPSAQQPSLHFPVPPGFDEHAVLDLYAIGVAAGVLGVFVPGLVMAGNVLGSVFVDWSSTWVVLTFMLLVPGVYVLVGACLEVCAPAEGAVVHARQPGRAMWGLCAAGQVVLLLSCLYSPDVGRALGFALALVHIVRLLQQAFSYPTGTCEEGVLAGDVEV